VKGAMIYPRHLLGGRHGDRHPARVRIRASRKCSPACHQALPAAHEDRDRGLQHLKHYWWLIGGSIGGLAFATKRYYATPIEAQFDRVMLRVPGAGDLIRKSASRASPVRWHLLASGVSIPKGWRSRPRRRQPRRHDAVMESRASIAGGETIAAPLQKSKVFPPMVISMIAVGEQPRPDEMLSRIRRLL